MPAPKWLIRLHDHCGCAIFDEREHAVCRALNHEQLARLLAVALQSLRKNKLLPRQTHQFKVELAEELEADEPAETPEGWGP